MEATYMQILKNDHAFQRNENSHSSPYNATELTTAEKTAQTAGGKKFNSNSC
jgi:hypothetical protein